MKFHKLYIAAIGAASMAMAGCELDIVNSDQLNTTNMWVDESDVTGATTGIYFELRNAFRQNYTNQFFWGELRVGPAMWDRGTNRSLMDSDMLEVLHSLLNGGTSSVSWTNLYTCINQCNSVIKYAPSVEMSDETRSYCLGNAYFVRAYVYYWIARVWGDAPVILTPTESTGREIYPSRSPRAEVYAQVAQDIESALTHITSNAKGCYYATVDNINMLKADFALWMYAAQKGQRQYSRGLPEYGTPVHRRGDRPGNFSDSTKPYNPWLTPGKSGWISRTMKESTRSATSGVSRVWNGKFRMTVSPGHNPNVSCVIGVGRLRSMTVSDSTRAVSERSSPCTVWWHSTSCPTGIRDWR